MSSYIGIDMGTSSVKTVLTDENGVVIRHAEEKYSVSSPSEGWMEIAPELWYEKTLLALGSMLDGFDAGTVRAIGITGQMHSTVFLGNDGVPLCPAILWNDGRSAGLISFLREKAAETVHVPYISDIISVGSPAANLFWLKTERPELFGKMKSFLIGPDYLVFKFTGSTGTDFCEASTSSLYDLINMRWSEEMAELIGLNLSAFPQVYGSSETAGMLLPGLAENLGLNPETVVLRGTGDNTAASLAAGVLLKGKTVISLGTSGVLMMRRSTVDFRKKGKNVLFSLSGENPICMVQGVVQSVGSSIDWWEGKIRQRQGYDDFEFSAQASPSTPVIFFPHLSGEKTLYHNSGLRGAFLKLSANTSPEELSLAMMEGICFGFRDLIENMQPDDSERIGIIGGGAANRFWRQLMADVLDRRIYRLPEMNGAAYGVAVLAADAIEKNGVLDRIVDRAWNGAEISLPRSGRREYLDKKYLTYKHLCNMLTSI